MKKTIIALLALGSVAMAAEPITINGNKFNADLAYRLNEEAWDGGTFTLHFVINEVSGFNGQQRFITLGTGDKALQLHSQESAYVGFATDSNPTAWLTSTNAGGVNTLVLDGATKGWFSRLNDGTQPTSAGQLPGLANSEWTIVSDGVSNTYLWITLGMGTDKQVTENITISNYGIDLNQVSVVDKISKISDAYVTYNGMGSAHKHDLMTPEPATATLSLLALAGLAARRRRH